MPRNFGTRRRPPLRYCVEGCGAARYTWREFWRCDTCTQRVMEQARSGESLRDFRRRLNAKQ